MSAPRIAELRKFLAAVGGALAQIVAIGVLHGTVLHVVQIVAACVAAVLVYVLGNADPKPKL